MGDSIKSKVLGGREEGFGEGEGTFLKKGFSLPSPNPIPPSPKTFVFIESLFAAFRFQCPLPASRLLVFPALQKTCGVR